MTTTNESAKEILEHVGGPGNIAALQHCSTRLRFNLVDDSKADEAALKAVPGVIGVVKGPQTQIVVGTNVAAYFTAIENLRGPSSAASGTPGTKPLTWRRAGSTVMDFVVSVFVPIIPAIAGAGIFKSLLVLFSALGWMDKTSQTFLVLTAIADAVFYFLPLLVTYTAAKKLNVNIPLALGIVSLLVFPTFTALVGQEGGTSLFGLPIPVVPYNAQVFPPILTVLLLAVVERYATKWTPGPIRVFFVPFLCFLIVSPIMIFLLGPLGFWLGSMLTSAMLGLYATLGWVAVALLAAVLPFIISVGMHKAFLPPTIATVAEFGKESFYLVSSLAHNIAESGSSFAVALRTRNKTLRGTAISAGISAFFGITEPALYGVTLQNRRALIAVMVGAFTGGAYMGIALVDGFVVVGPGAASISMYIDPTDPWNFIHAVIGFAVSFVVAFVVSLLLWRDSDSATLRVLNKEAGNDLLAEPRLTASDGAEIFSPIDGEVIPLSQVEDEVFSQGILGPGVAIRPTGSAVRAPITGILTSLLPSKHAIGITGDDGTEILVHIGFDTVKLEGRPFVAHVAQGDRVQAGQLVLEVDLDALDAVGSDSTTPVVILNEGADVTPLITSGPVVAGSPLLAVRLKETAK